MAENLKRTDLINAIEETRKSFDTDNPTVPFIEGDGIGIDIWPAAKKVFEMFITKKFKLNIFKKYSLDEIVKAHQDLENRKILGPAVIIP